MSHKYVCKVNQLATSKKHMFTIHIKKVKYNVVFLFTDVLKTNDSPTSVTSSPRSVVYRDRFTFKNPPFSPAEENIQMDLFKKPQYVSQLSKEELFQNYYMIEKLRKRYKEEIEKVLKRESMEKAMHLSDQEQLYENQFELKMKQIESEDNELEVYRDECDDSIEDEYGRNSLNSDDENYIVEAYNADDNELVISDIQITQKIERTTSSESSQSESLYLNLSECLSGGGMTENDGNEYLKTLNRQRSIPNGNVQIHIEVTREGEKYETRQQTLYDRNSNPRIQKIKLPSIKLPVEK